MHFSRSSVGPAQQEERKEEVRRSREHEWGVVSGEEGRRGEVEQRPYLCTKATYKKAQPHVLSACVTRRRKGRVDVALALPGAVGNAKTTPLSGISLSSTLKTLTRSGEEERAADADSGHVSVQWFCVVRLDGACAKTAKTMLPPNRDVIGYERVKHSPGGQRGRGTSPMSSEEDGPPACRKAEVP